MENDSIQHKSAETKLCPHCQKEIPKKATRCSYCQTNLRPWYDRHPILTVMLIAILICIVGSIFSSGNQSTTSQSSGATSQMSSPTNPNNSDLNATVQTGVDGLTITNNENSEWTNCMVGLNGGNGFGFDNPPYKTRSPLTIPPMEPFSVPYTDITLQDGTEFDPTTHAINSVVIECGQGTENIRDWIGSSGS